MWTFLIIAIIVFAFVQRRRYGRMCGGGGGCMPLFERKMQRRVDRAASKFERKSERTRARAGEPPEEIPRFRTDEEREVYERARKRVAAKADFYMHLVRYAIVIGALFVLNMLVSPWFQWWLWPAFFWGLFLIFRFGRVFGWRWIHDRVFEPAVKREVEREMTREREVMQTKNQASLDELTASFAHEIRNPIAAAKSLVQQMGEDPTSSENIEYAKVALDELARVERSVSHLLKYAKEEDYRFDNVNLALVLDAALTQMRGKLEAANVSVSRNYITGPTVRADAEKLGHVFTNMIDNSIDAMVSASGERRLELSIRSTGNGAACVILRDTGCGIPKEKIGKIFNPFYTTKSSGTGLGMGIARKVIEAHLGRIDVTSEVGVGTEFTVSIPLADAARGDAEARAAKSSGDDTRTSATAAEGDRANGGFDGSATGGR